MRAFVFSVLLLCVLAVAARNSTVLGIARKLTGPAHKFSGSLGRREPAKRQLRPVALDRALEPAAYFLQPTFEPFDPWLRHLSKPTFF
jgi:hypothetical protein